MLSLARRHRMRSLAAQVAIAAPVGPEQRPPEGPQATEYELMKAQLGQHLAQLREIQSIEKKIELKRQILPTYFPWIAGVLEAAKAEGARGVQDDVVVQAMIWLFDVGAFRQGLELADYVLRWKLELPTRFERTPGCLVAELVADAALKALGSGQPFDLDALLQADELTAEEDMPDQVRAKMAKAIGLELARRADEVGDGADGPAGAKRAAIEGALARFARALELDGKAGVKKQIERLERERSKLAEASAEDPSAA